MIIEEAKTRRAQVIFSTFSKIKDKIFSRFPDDILDLLNAMTKGFPGFQPGGKHSEWGKSVEQGI